MMKICNGKYFVSILVIGVCLESFGAIGKLIPAKVEVVSQNSLLDQPESGESYRTAHGRRNHQFGGTLSMIKLENSHLLGNTTIGCRRRRMRKFIGNKERNCTSLKPLKFIVCIGLCIPRERINRYFASFQRLRLKIQYKYRCSPHTFKYKKIRVFCADDQSLTRYRVKVVESCKCKEYKDQQNESQTPAEKIAERLRILSQRDLQTSQKRKP